jgi:anti-sigma B factor antagonist
MQEKLMKIDSRTVGDVRILDCSGKITLGQGTMTIRNSVLDILELGGRKIILNLADVNFIYSQGVGELVSTYTTVINKGGQIRLLSLTNRIREILAIAKLLTVFHAYESEALCVASFA